MLDGDEEEGRIRSTDDTLHAVRKALEMQSREKGNLKGKGVGGRGLGDDEEERGGWGGWGGWGGEGGRGGGGEQAELQQREQPRQQLARRTVGRGPKRQPEPARVGDAGGVR